MIKRLARAASMTALAASFTALAPTVASSQVVKSTFGPGDSYNSGTGWSVSSGQAIAQGFTYSGTNAFLSQVRLALFASGSNYSVALKTGTNINTATTLESWTFAHGSAGIATLASVLNPMLNTGDTYWLEALNGRGAWYWNDQGHTGFKYSFNGGTTWNDGAGSPSSAYDVTVGTTATPEPASLALLGTGLVGLGIPVLRRRRKSASIA